jgi:hypothetical protein
MNSLPAWTCSETLRTASAAVIGVDEPGDPAFSHRRSFAGSSVMLHCGCVVLVAEPRHVFWIGDRFIARRIVWPLAGRHAFHPPIVAAIHEERDGIAFLARVVDDAMGASQGTDHSSSAALGLRHSPESSRAAMVHPASGRSEIGSKAQGDVVLSEQGHEAGI